MIIKRITNTTYKKFIMNWNIYNNGILSVKTIHIPPKALNMEFSYADEADFHNCKKQNGIYFANGNLLVTDDNKKVTEKEAVSKNESNAKADLDNAEAKINKEVNALQEQAQRATKGKKSSAKLEVTTEQAGE